MTWYYQSPADVPEGRPVRAQASIDPLGTGPLERIAGTFYSRPMVAAGALTGEEGKAIKVWTIPTRASRLILAPPINL